MFKKVGKKYEVTQDFVWFVGIDELNFAVPIYVGYQFESSVPWFLRWILSPDHPKFLTAACVHDIMLEAGFSRPLSDSQWLEVARSKDAPRLKRELAFLAIRSRGLFGK